MTVAQPLQPGDLARAMLAKPAPEATGRRPADELRPDPRWLARVRELETGDQVRAEMAAWLDVVPWQAFVTLTFAPVLERNRYTRHHPEDWKRPQDKSRFAKKVAMRFLRLLNRGYFGSRGERRGESVLMFLPWEEQKWGALHAHPLIGGMPDGWRYGDVHEAWRAAQESMGLRPGSAWVKPFEPGGITSYVAKYVTKDARGDLWSLHGFGGRRSGWLRPA